MAKPFKVVNISDAGTSIKFGANDTDNIATFLNAQSDYHTYNYFIYKVSSTYYAKNGTTGVVDYSGSSFYTVISSVISALTSGGLILLGPGDFSLTTQLVVTQNNLKIRGMGVDVTRILYDMASTTTAGLKVTGSIGADKALTGNAAKDQYTVVIASTTGFVAGDWVYLVRNVAMQSGTATAYDAEIHEVASVTATDILFKNKIYAAYNTSASARVNEITWVSNFQIEDLTLYDNRATLTGMTDQCDTQFLFCKDLRIRNVKFDNMAYCCAGIWNCFDAILSDIKCMSPRFFSGSGINYGIDVMAASTNITINGLHATKCRHSVTTDIVAGSFATTYGPGRPRNIVVNNAVSWNSNTADFDSHEGAVGLVYNGCCAISGDPDAGLATNVAGFNARSPTIFNGCWTEGAFGICSNVFSDTNAAGTVDLPGGDGTIFNSCQFKNPMTETAVEQVAIYIDDNRSGVKINNCVFHTINDEVIRMDDGANHISILGNTFITCGTSNGTTEGIIDSHGTCHDLMVINNDFSAGTPPASSRPLVITTASNGINYSNNNVRGLTYRDPIIPSGSTAVIRSNNIGDNINTLLATPDTVKMGTWYGGANTEVDGLLTGRLSTIAVGTGTQSTAVADSTGNYRTFDTAATINSLAGDRVSTRTYRGDQNCYSKAGIYLDTISNVRIFVGFVNSSSAPASAADPLNALEGIALWFDSAVNANWRILHNDSSGASVSDDTGLAAATGTLLPVEIFAQDSNKFRFVFNNTITDVSSNIPASTTSLGYYIYIENTTAASRTMRGYYLILRNDK